jgi:hypothetical protein
VELFGVVYVQSNTIFLSVSPILKLTGLVKLFVKVPALHLYSSPVPAELC